MSRIIEERYPASEWNIYGAQASDGDNWKDDSPKCVDLLRKRILPHTQYYAYVEITERDHQSLWQHYLALSEEHSGAFAQCHIRDAGDIFPVFHDLFRRRTAA